MVLAFRGRAGARSLGGTTYGDAVDATVHRLADGATLRVVRYRLADRDGAVADGPLRTDVAVTSPATTRWRPPGGRRRSVRRLRAEGIRAET